jgi:stress response protein YsnF
MLSQQELTEAIGAKAYGPDGDEIGRVEHFFVDDRTGAPTWVAVTTGLFGTRHSIVPALDASFSGGTLRLPVGREAVRSAPSPGDTQHLDPEEEARLRAHYRLDQGGWAEPAPGEPATRTAAEDAGTGRAADAPAGAPGDGSMVRSEERLKVGTETTARTRVRVVRYVVTEEVQVTVPLRREEIRVEEVPLDSPDVADETLDDGARGAGDADGGAVGRHAAGGTGTGTGGLPEEIVLHREEPVVSVRVVPAERVRLRTEVVRGTEQVSGQVQRERITVDEHPPVGREADRDLRRGVDAGA